MRISAALPQGVTALFFDAARRRRSLEARLVERLEAADFSEVVLPIVDYLEPYEPLLTAASRGELYRFIDRDGELLALRADFTPMLARLLAPMLTADAPGQRDGPLTLPLRLFYRGDVVRYEEERPGRQRELYQVGAELLGVPGIAAEREMLRLFLSLLAVAGEGRMRVVLGFAGALDRPLAAAAAEGSEAGALAAALSRRERGLFARAASGSARSRAPWARTLSAVLENGVPADPAELGEPAAERLGEVVALAASAATEFPGIAAEVDLAEFADQILDPDLGPATAGGTTAAGAERSYYDGLVFRAYAGAVALPAGAGGRYDGLFRRLGADLPAVGFSLGLDRLGNGRHARPTLAADPRGDR
ncbi:MAG TPA: ATP phosphoribosyltransferase regulatory subunit [Thermoanaerobaculia bacterium]|nr:ATP phosphoribosyltransferase regulatory subunit [Thermoanaerobaculia bacterium]